MLTGANPEIMSSGGVDVQFGGDAGLLQGEVHQDTVFRATDKVVPTMSEEDWGSLGRNAEAGGQFVLVLRLEIAWIGENGEIGPAADQVDVIDWLVGAVVNVS